MTGVDYRFQVEFFNGRFPFCEDTDRNWVRNEFGNFVSLEISKRETVGYQSF